MKHTWIYKRLALAILLITAMIATAGCGPAGIAFALDQINQADATDEQDDDDQGENEDDQGENEDEVEGIIESIDGNTIVINGQTFTVPDDLLDELALLSSGMEIEVEFFIDDSGGLFITEFEFEDEVGDLDDDDQGENDDDQGEDEDDDDDDSESGGGGEDDDD